MSEHTSRYIDPAAGLVVARESILGGLAEAAARHAMLSDAELGLHTTEPLSRPLGVGFGVYSEKLRYTEGCVPVDELSRGVGVVSAKVGGSIISIMRTPQEYKSGYKRITDAGEPDEFLVTGDVEGENTAFWYLNEVDIAGVVLAKGEKLAFAQKLGRRLQLMALGVVDKVVGFR